MQVKKWVLINALVSAALTLLLSNTLVAAATICPAIDDDRHQIILIKSQTTPCGNLNIEENDRLIKAIRLSEYGLHSEAQKELTEVIKANPDTKFSEDFINSIVSKRSSLLERIESSLTKFNSWLALMIAPAVLASAIIFYYRQRNRIYLDIKDFNDDNLDLKVGKSTTAALKNLLLKTAEPGETSRPNIATEPIGKFESTIDVKQLSLPLQLLNKLFLSRSFALSGYYQRSTQKGIGLVLVLKLPSGTIKTEKFWQKDYDPQLKISKQEPQGLEQLLARAAASWLLFKLDKKSFERWLGFDRWESYAFSKVGEYWLEKNDYNQAETMMKKSLFYHPNNKFSLFNLGIIKFKQILQKPSQNRNKTQLLVAASKNSLLRARHIIESDTSRLYSLDPIWHKILYQLIQINEYKIIEYGFSQKLAAEVEHFQKECIENECLRLNLLNDRETNDSLEEFIDKFLAISKIAYATFLVRNAILSKDISKLKPAAAEIKDIENEYKIAFAQSPSNRHKIAINPDGNLSLFDDLGNLKLRNLQAETIMLPLAGYYNLACYYTAVAEIKESDLNECKSYASQAIIYLKYVFKQDRSQEEWAKKDPSLKWLHAKYPELIP